MPSQDAPLLNQLRNNIEFASVSQFLHTFQAALEPSRYAQRSSSQTGSRQATPLIEEGPFDTEHFEQMLLDDGERYRLEYLIIRLLKVLTRNRLISSETWQLYLIREFYKREPEENNPFYQEKYWPFPMSKTKIIYEPTDPSSKPENGDEDAASSVLSEEETDENDKTRDSTEPEVKKESDIKTEEQTPEIEVPLEEQPDPINFFDLDLDTKLHVLHTLCEWQLDDPERMREHLPSEDDAAHWRVDPVGYDANGNTYWLFDDNRLYRESPAPPKSKSKNKSKAKGSGKKKKQPPPPPPVRRGTRRGLRSGGNATPPPEEEEEVPAHITAQEETEEEWKPWKMLCITAGDWQAFPARFENSKNRDEQRMYQYLTKDLLPQILPILEEREKEKKLEQALNNRKRSSRIQIRDLQHQERLRQEVLAQQALQHQQRHRITRQDEITKKREAEAQAAAANSREERLRERELRIQQREVEKAKAISRQEEKAARDAAREQEKLLKEQQKAERKLQQAAQTDKNGSAQAPKPVKKRGPRKKKPMFDEDNWTFDCLCGVKGQNLDDGTPMIACGRCGTWAHIACLAKHDKTRKSMKAWENVDYTCRNCLARPAHPPPAMHYTIDHQKERTVEHNTHKRPWMESSSPHQHHQANPVIKFTKPNEGPVGYNPPRVPVYNHHSGGGYIHDGSPRVDVNQHRYPQPPIQFHHQNGHSGQPRYATSPPSAAAPRPPQPHHPQQQQQLHHHQPPSNHGYPLPMAPISRPGFSSHLPPLQSRPPSQPTHNQLPHLNAIQPSATKLPFPPQSEQRAQSQQHSAFTPLPAPSAPILPPIHHQAPAPYRPPPPPVTSSYRPQEQFPGPRPMPPNPPEQRQG
ncbi:hypothetical protein BGW37DRAFT_91186 [Umbelopsis sp. PMI_123]|nr:hypothetical protein BGW37DRAFT_91186 [Umbelopsis sp. PMI_123]